ncbi:Transketolase central region [Pyrolobus fumarii 1A]|uniref:2-oxoacid oxidoreductase (ferredoxin) n=2 Tax=Pyrolobus fumarii TaxID=54252 RepID=G0EHA5_PYRF1|nr:Transketolase central region [Pyrolobus fumarii 1A]
MTMRDAVGRALVELGEEDPDMVVVTADVARSTRTSWFGEKFPERFVNVGIGEQDLVDFAAGLALAGKRPWAAAFAMFMMRAWEQIRNTIDRMRLNVKLLATHSGFSDHSDGSSHQSLEDVALMRVLHNMVVVVPADALEAYKAVRALHWDVNGPAYLRVGRDYSPVITEPETPFRIGNANILRDGDDLAIVGCGPILYQALRAADILEKKIGVKPAVIDMHTIKPIDRHTIVKYAQKTGFIVTVEEHYTRGGLGGAVAEVLAEEYPTRILMIGARGYGHSARSIEDLYRAHCLVAECIAKRIEEALRGVKN